MDPHHRLDGKDIPRCRGRKASCGSVSLSHDTAAGADVRLELQEESSRASVGDASQEMLIADLANGGRTDVRWVTKRSCDEVDEDPLLVLIAEADSIDSCSPCQRNTSKPHDDRD